MEPGSQRRVIGFVLFGSAVLLVAVAAMFWTGAIAADDETRTTISGIVGAMGVLDAAMGVYFIVSADR